MTGEDIYIAKQSKAKHAIALSSIRSTDCATATIAVRINSGERGLQPSTIIELQLEHYFYNNAVYNSFKIIWDKRRILTNAKDLPLMYVCINVEKEATKDVDRISIEVIVKYCTLQFVYHQFVETMNPMI